MKNLNKDQNKKLKANEKDILQKSQNLESLNSSEEIKPEDLESVDGGCDGDRALIIIK